MSASENLTVDQAVQAGDLVRVAAVSELEGRKAGIVADVAGTEVLVVSDGSELYAFVNLCTHRSVWLDQAIIHPDTGELQCPAHDGRFDLRTGAASKLPCMKPLETFEVKVVDGEVFVVAHAADADAD